MAIVLLAVFVVLLLLEVPVVFCMLAASLAALLYAGVDPIIVGLEMSRAMSTFYPFLAVPFFILAGDLMNEGGLSRRITDLANALLGHRRGGLALVTTASAQMFGAVSGAASATCAAIGRLMIPAMEREGYPRAFSAALAACSGITGALIPPSIMLLIYGTVASVSIEKLFLAGVLPGLLMGASLAFVSWRYARSHAMPVRPRAQWSAVGRSALSAIWAVLLVIIIFGGIFGGVFTATEASAVAVVYALAVSLLVYRQVGVKDLPRIFVNAAKTTATLSFLIAAAGLFSWVLSVGNIPQLVTGALLGACDVVVGGFEGTLSPEAMAVLRLVVVLLVVNILLLCVGAFVDAGPALLIVVPILKPIGVELGIDPVHFGVIIVSNLVLGLVTPPVGTTLFVASGVGGVSLARIIPHALRFLPAMFVVQMLITFVPRISTFLPGVLGR
ncbi:C4-dicarboxylate TRAP transporter large permease protein DctM [Opitutales bacterium ASA1]|uniref:TRAP transporter large permease n=1 Tax=Congregicoccus parvus TaxID=3081749 RepID=UPI002B2C1653|nr:C4-dicarboxylate TRAP transporter large permease protein DctM [Opitutales bacterium ASA1]